MENIDVAKVFNEVADLLEIQGANVFRVRAYRNAARTVEMLGAPVESMVSSGSKLEELPGVGKDLAGKIREIVETGELGMLRELAKELPEGLVALMRIPGVGPKRAKQVYESLGIATLDDLEAAARAGKLRELRGLGPTIEARILQGITEQRAHTGRHALAEAEVYVKGLVEHLRRVPGLKSIEVAGSFRRRRETVGDIDVLVAAEKPDAVAEAFVTYPQVKEVTARGDTRSAVVLRSGLQVDLRVVPEASFGAALHYFTGSKPHNIAIRTLGVKRKLKINEYGVFRGPKSIGGRTEEEVFKAVGLPWIPPELREDRGEIDAARENALPKLVSLDEIRGDLQMHTTYTDGKASVAQMAEACRALGYQYIAITDHTKAVRVAGGLDRTGFRKQFREIDRVQKGLTKLTILKSAEVDILDNGTLDLDEGTLAALEVVVVAVHSRFTLSRDEMTRRVVRALQHPRVHILAHPTGRLIGRREPYAIDMEQVIKAAADHGVMVEINAQPDRLDLSDVHVQMARAAHVMTVVSTDAHRPEELRHMRYGLDQARRGWCEARDVANTYPLKEFRALLREGR